MAALLCLVVNGLAVNGLVVNVGEYGAEVGHDNETPGQRQFPPHRVQLRKLLPARSDAKFCIRFYLSELPRTESMRNGSRWQCVSVLVHGQRDALTRSHSGE